MKKRLTHTIDSVIKELVSQFEKTNLYYGHGTDNALDEAAWLVLHVLGKPLHEQCDITEFVDNDDYEKISLIAAERVNTQKPLAYLLKSSWFCGLEFYIDERALIPRSPIAELIAEQFSPWLQLPEKGVRILDMCTGSACIAIAAALHIDKSTVDACDISAEALEVAKQNIQKHQVEERVFLYKSDIFDGLDQSASYDLIICNPPYVDKEDMDALPDEYKHEPELALASGDDGLNFTRIFLQQAKRFLKPGGGIILEVGNSAEALEHNYPDLPKIWLDFEYGGEGVCFISADHLS